ncbi:MAG: heparan-alpha-glucosaminide N-acetyltransferase [Candidatus Thermoplasmatota archaeon]|jgi:uncharacterized membrane protein|nr:heparan-alpha-glucosaminide N-acetyltransferase [Candidatus Thermoplasmatota archaeon]MDP7266266.1 heparan-alpha-glucosaminide N-acetyltransferase [Candidatus Thermoplasmatota archaeon]
MNRVGQLDSGKKRFWEVDFARGIAITMMIIFHLIYDLDYFLIKDFTLNEGFWYLFRRSIAISFLLLVGISLNLSHFREGKKVFSKSLKRGLKIFGLGLCITLVTYIFLSDAYVRFGILHLIGLSIIIAYFFLDFYVLNLFIGVFVLSIGYLMGNIHINTPWFFWLGLRGGPYPDIDFFPLFPWIGIIFIGLFLGKLLYGHNKRKFRMIRNCPKYLDPMCFLGKHSLFIYLIHQPILIIILALLGLVDIEILWPF